ncbi:hypothetical protein RIR_jg40138.t1 [Rhizophagus irregularis DAOM 181602=DAOM 197198]|nr:hypothetical protein RIR_jg40138.t1 [Rhizophagus irregularis DAOM 181602=DAOM 197198]
MKSKDLSQESKVSWRDNFFQFTNIILVRAISIITCKLKGIEKHLFFYINKKKRKLIRKSTMFINLLMGDKKAKELLAAEERKQVAIAHIFLNGN